MVMGNNDWFSNLPAEIQVNIDDYRAFITHGHNYGVSLGLEESMRRRFPGVWISYCSAIRTGRSQKAWKSLDCQSGSLTYPRQMGRKTKLCHADDQ